MGDGVVFNGNQGNRKNYEPNSFSVFAEQKQKTVDQTAYPMRGLAQRYKPAHPNSDFEQAGVLYSKVMTQTDRDHLISNLSGAMSSIPVEIKERQTRIFYK